MRVLSVTINMFPNSGWGRYAWAVARGFSEKGIDNDVLTYQKKNEVPVKEARFEEFPLLESKLTILSIIRNTLRARYLAKKADVVHAYDIWPFALYGYGSVLGTKKKLFVTGVGTYSVVPFHNPLKKFFLTLALKRVSAVLSVSEYTKSRILEMVSLKNIPVVPWGTSVLKKFPEEKISEWKKKFNIIHEHPIILTVGQIKERKGHFDTVKAIEKLVGKYPHILYVMVGGSQSKEYIQTIQAYADERGFGKNIRFVHDAKTDEDLSFFYQLSDLFIMASNSTRDYFEGFGLVFLEAEQFGKPVIGTRDNGPQEALRDGYNGYLVKQRDPSDIAEKIDMILSEKQEEFGRNSIEFQKHFTWQKTVDAYVKAYNHAKP